MNHLPVSKKFLPLHPQSRNKHRFEKAKSRNATTGWPVRLSVMLQKTKGIVLHTLKYNDTSIIVDMYTELSGRASFLVTVPRSRKAAVKSVLFQPLSFIEFEADYRPNATLYRVKEAKSFYPFSSIPYDPY